LPVSAGETAPRPFPLATLEINEDRSHSRTQLLHGWKRGRVVPIAEDLGVGRRLILRWSGIQIQFDAGQRRVECAAVPAGHHAGVVPAEPRQGEWSAVELLQLRQAGIQGNSGTDAPAARASTQNYSRRMAAAHGILPDDLGSS